MRQNEKYIALEQVSIQSLNDLNVLLFFEFGNALELG